MSLIELIDVQCEIIKMNENELAVKLDRIEQQLTNLNGDTDAIASVQAEKVDLDAAYKIAIAGVEGSAE